MIIACSAAKLIAEGLETLQQLDYLLDLGCDEYQGYCFSKALVAIILSVTYEAWRARMLDLVFVVLKLSKTRLFHLVYDYLLDLLFKANTIANFTATNRAVRSSNLFWRTIQNKTCFGRFYFLYTKISCKIKTALKGCFF